MTPLECFDLYSGMGFQVIPLYHKTKIPIGNNWNKKWDIKASRNAVSRWSNCNFGILLGDIVDVEGDSEEANEFINLLIGDIPHPVYRSRKSFHHLFRTPDPELTACRFEDIEFRGHRHQSVIPPSIGPDGTRYQWLRRSVEGFPIPEMPLDLKDLYFKFRPDLKPVQKKRSKKKGKKKNHKKTQCCICKKWIYIHRKRLILEVRAFREYGVNWHCQKCRELELRPAAKRIRKEMIESGDAAFHKLISKKRRNRWEYQMPQVQSSQAR